MVEMYKKDTKGKIRVLKVFSEGSKVIQQSGLIDGKLTTNERICKAKNVGRSNATTDAEQAVLEAEAIIVKKLKDGYYKTVQEAKESVNLMPMLATKADLDKLEYPVMIQPKLDGIRMIATNKSKLSRKNREFDTLGHIDLSNLPDGVILDGEVYAHGLSFQENTKLIKKYKKGKTEQVKYHVYDCPSTPDNFIQRKYKAFAMVDLLKSDSVVIVPSCMVDSEEQLLSKHQQYIDNGYEGTMVRTLDCDYEFGKRSKSLRKLKDFIDETYEIVDVLPSDKIPSQGVVQCKTSDGKLFSCGMKMSHSEREDILINKHEVISKLAEVRFFEHTDNGLPRFPVYYGVRLDK